ncbi:MAG: HAMP domain-containing protein [Bdellovibrionaceae bacterium]|nr:HAMP domain-containing protein [Pseudobdellovibrionaceae bacterium]
MSRFKSAVQEEMFQRLLVYARQIQTVLLDYESFTKNKINAICEDKIVGYNWKTGNTAELETALTRYFEEDIPAGATLYDASGAQVIRVGTRPEAKGWGAQLPSDVISRVDSNDVITRAYYQPVQERIFLILSVLRKTQDEALGWSGYAEYFVLLGPETVGQIKKEQKLDVIFFGPAGEVFVSSLPGEKFSKTQLSQDFLRGNNHFFDIPVKGNTFGFISTAISWGEQKFLVAIGASKESLSSGLQELVYFVFGAVVVLLFCLLAFSYFFSRQIILPVVKLVDGVQTMRDTAEPVYVQPTVDNEIGLLTDQFNDMSQRMHGYRKDLENKLQDLENANKEINDAQTQLIQSAKLAGLGQLVAGVAHELNNPIGFVYSNIQHLREYVTGLTEFIEEMGKTHPKFQNLKTKYDYEFIAKDLPKLITSCEEGAKRTRDIVTGLRNFSRASDKENKKFSIADCIDSTLDLIQSTQTKSNIVIQKRMDEFTPLIEGNPNQMSQVFMNLFSNAIQAMGEAGVLSIDVSFRSDQSLLEIRIKDTGQGISAENLTRIFDPFFTTKDIGQGTGLGLSISYGIIKSHGGEITATSELGVGTEFIVSLPTSNS